jgi:hypothetical protein
MEAKIYKKAKGTPMRARNIKPSLFTNELLGCADPLLTILFEGLWCIADREGRLEDRPLRIKAEIFPYRENLDVNGYLTVIERMGFIQRYKVGEMRLIQVLNFSKHQHPHHTERPSFFPGVDMVDKGDYDDNGLLTVKTPLSNGESPVTLRLIPDSYVLIPDSKVPPYPPNGDLTVKPPLPKKTSRRSAKPLSLSSSPEFRLIPEHIVELAKSIAVCTPKTDEEGRKIRVVVPTLIDRLSSLLENPSITPDLLEQSWRDYLASGPMKIKAPQYFFGKAENQTEYAANWRAFAAVHWHKTHKNLDAKGEVNEKTQD